MRTLAHRLLPLLALAVSAEAQAPSAGNPDPNLPRPIEAHDSVFIEELTWPEVRDALRAGKTTVIVATGGVEQNGPTSSPASTTTCCA